MIDSGERDWASKLISTPRVGSTSNPLVIARKNKRRRRRRSPKGARHVLVIRGTWQRAQAG